MSRHHTTHRDDASRPPLFTPDEWRRLVGFLLLSDREAEVVGWTVQGESDKQIAKHLGIAPNTVYSHLKHARAKLNAGNRNRISYCVFETFLQHIQGPHPQK